MRESIGATWILGIVLAFIALFSGYLAFSVNYSKAFRIKDGIVDRLQKHNGLNNESVKDISELMSEIGYSSKGNCSNFFTDSDLKYAGVVGEYVETHANSAYDNNTYNYCVQKVKSVGSEGQLTASYYKVYVFFSLSLPFFNSGSTFNVSGETVNLYYPEDNYL